MENQDRDGQLHINELLTAEPEPAPPPALQARAIRAMDMGADVEFMER